MDRSEFNPLIPENAIENYKVSDNPLIPVSLATSGHKRLAAVVSSKSKDLPLAGARRLLSPPTSMQLATINRFASREHVADEMLVGQMRLANNCVDRDNERFSEQMIKNFADTVVRKTVLLDHDSNVNRSAIGKFFDVEVERIPLQQANFETGELLQLPAGMEDVLFLSPWFFIPKKGVSGQDLARLESGVFDFVSIGFSAERLVPITDGQGTTLFHEYQGGGYVREGSIVYLGAQPGATIKAATASALSHSSAGNPLIIS